MRYISQYNLNTRALELFITGCCGKCTGCHNHELKSYDIGTKITDEEIERIALKTTSNIVDNVMIMGGEPLDRPTEELMVLLNRLDQTGLPIWLFTRYEITDVPEKIREVCAFIKTGEYIEELRTKRHTYFGIELATSNQKILKKGTNY